MTRPNAHWANQQISNRVTSQPTRLPSAEGLTCPLCSRLNYHPSDHHLVPRSRGGTETTPLCEDCHRAIHLFLTNESLARRYNTVAALRAHWGLKILLPQISLRDSRKLPLSKRQLRRLLPPRHTRPVTPQHHHRRHARPVSECGGGGDVSDSEDNPLGVEFNDPDRMTREELIEDNDLRGPGTED